MPHAENEEYRKTILDRLQEVQEKNKQTVVFFHNYSKLVEQLKRNNMNKDYSIEGSENASTSAEIIRTRQEISDLYRFKSQNDQNLIDVNKHLKELDEKLASINPEKERLAKEYDLICAQYANLEVNIQKLNIDKTSLNDEIIALTATSNLLRKQKSNLEEERLQLHNKVRQLNDQNRNITNSDVQLHENVKNETSEQSTLGVNANSKDVKGNAELQLLSKVALTSDCLLFDTIPSNFKFSFQSDAGEVCDVVWLTEDTFATGGTDTIVKLWKLEVNNQQRKIGSLTGANGTITEMDYDNNKKHLIASSSDKTVRIWNTETSRLLTTFSGHSDQVTCVKFYSMNSALSGSADRIIKIWDLSNQRCSRSFFPASKVLDVLTGIESNPNMFVSGHLDKKTRVWDGRTSEPVKVIDMSGRVTSLSCSVNGNQILCSTRDDTLVLFDIRNYHIIHIYSSEEYRINSDFTRCTMSPGGEYVSAGGSQGNLFVWNTQTTKLETVMHNKSCQQPIYSVSWNPTGQGILSASKHKSVTLWK